MPRNVHCRIYSSHRAACRAFVVAAHHVERIAACARLDGHGAALRASGAVGPESALPWRSVEYLVGGGGGHELFIRRINCVVLPSGVAIEPLHTADPAHTGSDVVFTVSGAGLPEVRACTSATACRT